MHRIVLASVLVMSCGNEPIGVEQGEENLRVNEERYKAQVSTILDLLTAQALLVQARVNNISALYTHALAKATLDRAIGVY